MPRITTSDGIGLYYEEAGAETPILFIHEFGGNHASWEPQMRFFARRHRCITYLEKPDAFNRLVAGFVAQVEPGAWHKRDTRADPSQIMQTD